MSNRLDAVALTTRVGVEVRGIDLGEELSEQRCEQLRSLMWEHSVLVFRDQDISAEDQIRLVEVFGTVSDEFGDGSRHSYVSNMVEGAMLMDGGLLFHSDLTYTPAPYLVISLAAVEVRGAAAPTRYASLVGGYESLPEELRQRGAGLTNVHLHWHLDGEDYVKTDVVATPSQAEYGSLEDFPRHTWPVVHHHHRTGRPMLYVSPWFSHITGWSEADSEALLQELYGYMYAPENIYEHHWRQGDVVVWDNLAVQHGRPTFRGTGAVRTLRRVMASEQGRSMEQTYQLAGAAMPSTPMPTATDEIGAGPG